MSLFEEISECQDFKQFKQRLYHEYKGYFDLNDFLVRTVAKIIDESHPQQQNLHSAVVDFLFKKGFKTYWAILLLSRDGFGQDGGMLLRTLLEILMNIHWMSKEHPEQRVRDYVYFDNILRKRLIDNIEKWKPTDKKLQEMNIYDRKKVQNNFDELDEDFRKRRFWSGKSPRDMAKDIGLEYDYDFVYQYFSNFIHSSARSSLQFLSWKKDGLTFEMFSSKEIVKLLYYGYWYMLLIFAKWNEVLNCEHTEIIGKFSEKLKPHPHYKELFP